jgi:hypothetical protein
MKKTVSAAGTMKIKVPFSKSVGTDEFVDWFNYDMQQFKYG